MSRNHGSMATAAPYEALRRVAAVIARLRVPLLVLAGLVVAHDAIFASDVGFAAFTGALARSGHGDAWALISIIGIAGATLAAVGTVARILRLRREIDSLGTGSTARSAGPGLDVHRAEVRSLWPRLFGAIAIGFLVQENAEALLGGGHLAGLDPLLGAHPFAIPILLVLTLAMAVLGTLIRRQTRALEELVSLLRAGVRRHVEAHVPRPSLGALHPRDLIRLRPQAGRAPPFYAVPVSA